VPLFFFMHVTRAIVEAWSRDRARSIVAAVLVGTVAMFLSAPLLAAPRMILANVHAWTDDDNFADAFQWLRDNTKPSDRCIVPPDRQDVFAKAERPTVANFQAIRYDRLPEWKDRIDALVGGSSYFDRPGWTGNLDDLRRAYDRLTPEQVSDIARRYDAACIVTSTMYPFTPLHTTGDVHIYRIGD
jgi:hypothetical protein